MVSRDPCHRSEWIVLVFVNCLCLLLSVKSVDVTPDKAFAAGNAGYESRTYRRGVFGTTHTQNDIDDIAYVPSWKEIEDVQSDHNFSDSIQQKTDAKNRLGIFHFGKINQFSILEEYKNKRGNEYPDETEEHPLRTNVWELDLKWSLLSTESKQLCRTKDTKSKQKECNVQLELDPEGYCRICEKTFAIANTEDGVSDSIVLGIGRWRKRPWGVTIIVRPFCPLNSSMNVTNNVIDEHTEFVFHANNFHWNGFGSNPKLTQGTILFQRKKKRNATCWWKSSILAYSSILPVWPEELSGNYVGDKAAGAGCANLGAVHSNVLSLSGLLSIANRNRNSGSSQRGWFRPVVGTFTAKGIVSGK